MAGRRVFNVAFHGIGSPQRPLEPGEDRYWVEDERFVALLDELNAHPHVQLSFDDGNASDVEIALPALQRRSMRAAFFVIAARLDEPGSLSRADVEKLVVAGMTVGSHGMYHQPWRGLGESARQEEFVAAREAIRAASGKHVDEAACPFGTYDRRSLGDLRRLGYRRVYTSDGVSADADQWIQPRYSVRREDDVASIRQLVTQLPPLPMRAARRGWQAVKRWR